MRASRLASEEQFSGDLAGIPSRKFGQERPRKQTMRRSKSNDRRADCGHAREGDKHMNTYAPLPPAQSECLIK
jgi:hypothetical protein